MSTIDPAYDKLSTIVDLLEYRAEREAGRAGWIFLSDGEEQEQVLTYGELARAARAIAAELSEHCRRGDRVLLVYPPGLDFVKGLFGCLYAGLVVVPSYPPDPTRLERSVPRLRAIGEDARVSAMLSTDVVVSNQGLVFEHAESLRKIRFLATDRIEPSAGGSWRHPGIAPESLAVIQYTSGSTGSPKGVMVPHANILSTCRVIHEIGGSREDDRAVIWLPQFHDLGLFEGTLFPVFARELPRVLMSPVSFLQRPMRWMRAVSRYRARASAGPNFAYDLCTRKSTPEERASLDLSEWDTAIIAAEPVRKSTMDRFAEAFGPCGFDPKAFFPSLGLAEATLIVSSRPRFTGVTTRRLDRQQLAQGRAVTVPDGADGIDICGCGYPYETVPTRIVDPETLHPRGVDEVGEIWIGGPDICRGYWQRPNETERVFRARIDGDQTPYLRTGDLGFIGDDGELYVTGRLKDVLILRGRNVYPQDIELVVDECHPAIRRGSGAVVGVERDAEERVVVVQEVYPSDELDVQQVASAIRQSVVNSCQEAVHGVVLLPPGAIPKTSSGKIQRHAVREALAAGSLESLGEVWV